MAATVLGPLAGSARAAAAVAPAAPHANSHWTYCNDTAVTSAPKPVWWRIEGATKDHADIPATFWTNVHYRGDLAKIICYESTYDWHAVGPGQYGWYQMTPGLVATEGVSFAEYWDGTSTHEAGWYQCTAGERYILSRYGTPAAAWAHERDYGWY